MAQKVGSHHDRFVRHCLDDLEVAKGFFRLFLKPKPKDEIDIDGLQPCQTSFISPELKQMTTDLLYHAPIRNHHGFLSLLVEHKSEGAARGDGHILPFQMRFQEMMVMDYGQRNDPDRCYPLVYMVGLYHGDRGYSGPKSVSERIKAPESMIPERWHETIELIDLSGYTDEELLADGKLGVFLLVLKHIYASDILQTLELLAPQMQRIEQEHGDEFLGTLFRYLYEALKLENHKPVNQIAIKTFSKETGDKMITIADSLREEGLKEGELRKSVEIVKNLISKGFTDDLIQDVTGLALEQIQAIRKQKDPLNSA
jgi:predicted transposase/invertase (TIGR01784 family)